VSHPNPADVPAEEADEWPPHAPETFQEIGRIGRIAIALLGLSTVTHLLSTWSDWNTYGVVDRYLGGQPNVSDADLNRADTIARLTSLPNVVISVAAAVVFVLWLWRARVNSEVFCQADHRHSHGWVLASWFCPGPNLWYPKQIVDDVWTASDPRTPSWTDELRPRRRIIVTSMWWACWLGAMVFDIAVRRLLMWIDPSVGVLRGIAVAATFSLVLTAASALFAAQVIRKITAMQTKRPWVPWWDEREPAHLTAVTSYAEATAEESTMVAPTLRLERKAELQFAGAVGGEAPRWGNGPVDAPAARLTAVPNNSPLQAPPIGGGSPLPPAGGSPLQGPLGSPSPTTTPRAPEPEKEEAPAWSPFAPLVESWSESEPAEATAVFTPSPDTYDQPKSSPSLGDSSFGESARSWSVSVEPEVPASSGDSGYDDPLSTTAWLRDRELREEEWKSENPPALSVVPPPAADEPSYRSSSYSYSDSYQPDYLAPSRPIPTPEPAAEPVRRPAPGRRAAAVAVDSPSSIQPQPGERVQAPQVSGLPAAAAADDYLTPSKPLPPVPSFGPEPSYESSYSSGSYYSGRETHNSSYDYSSAPGRTYEAALPVEQPPAAVEPPAEPPAKPATPRVHSRRRWS